MKMGKKKNEDDTAQAKVYDPLLPILKKCGFPDNQPLEEEAAIQVKNEALRSLKERLLTRATIIQNRLDEEQETLEKAYVSILMCATVVEAAAQLFEFEFWDCVCNG